MQGIGEHSPSSFLPSDRSSVRPFGSELLDMIRSMEKASVLGAADGPVKRPKPAQWDSEIKPAEATRRRGGEPVYM
ncbi:hypothetical protein EYF80_001416 [Liparis tanakae]|uniref:Uncharacterized protein n=1 Tax=Liparis tanakae TaxID=230148 RepID=A0A4Z2JDE7_9TELE|nr:hypothetical protein EYF80_001416 [Liparis tanakae]